MVRAHLSSPLFSGKLAAWHARRRGASQSRAAIGSVILFIGIILIIAGAAALSSSSGGSSSSSSISASATTVKGSSSTTAVVSSSTIVKTTPTITFGCAVGAVTSADPTTSCMVQLIGTQTNPTGSVSFTSALGSNSCQLSGAQCTLSLGGPATWNASYPGDEYNLPTSATYTIQEYQQVPLTIEALDSMGNPTTSAQAGVAVSFVASGCSGCTYTWSFGDGGSVNTGTSASVTHVYSSSGSYEVTVSAQSGFDYGSKSMMLDVSASSSSGAFVTVVVQAASTGSVIQGALVTLSGPSGTLSNSTNAGGFVTFSDLQPGSYSVVAEQTGFANNGETILVGSNGQTVYIGLTSSTACLTIDGRLSCPQSLFGGSSSSLSQGLSEVIAGMILVAAGYTMVRKKGSAGE